MACRFFRLAAQLPRGLEKLDLGLAQSGVSNVGLAALDTGRESEGFSVSGQVRLQLGQAEASAMPAALQELRLDLNYCSKISDSGLAALGDHLPSRLRYLKAS